MVKNLYWGYPLFAQVIFFRSNFKFLIENTDLNIYNIFNEDYKIF